MSVDTADSAHAQNVPVGKNEEEFFPEHPPRKDTPEYHATHKLLINKQDKPCFVCGVRKSTLGDPTKNPFGAKQMETHHRYVQREFADAVDWRKVAADFPDVTDRESFVKWVDSPENMLVLCDVHHRSTTRGIHHILTSDFWAERYLLDGYILEDVKANAQKDILLDNEIVNDNVPLDERT
jgi:hypothetical protein